MRIATEAELARMSWHARAKYDTRLRAFLDAAEANAALIEAEAHARPRSAQSAKKERVTIRRLPTGWWEMTNGINHALFPTAQAAWALLARMDVAS